MKGTKKESAFEVTSFEITRAKEFKEGQVSFDLKINGITIYSMWYRECKRKDNGEEFTTLNFPQEKGNDGKYYNRVWFPISEELKAQIIDKLQEMV